MSPLRASLVVSVFTAACASSGPPAFVAEDADTPLDAVEDVALPPPFDIAPVESGMCAAGQQRCNGECVDPQSAVAHCGLCGNDCRRLPGVEASRARCVRGACDLNTACTLGRVHCSANPSDGCESDATTSTRCGACSIQCTGMNAACSLTPVDGGAPVYQCTTTCGGMTPATCGSVCADLAVDPMNCGACGTTCPARFNARGSCVRGVCGLTCNPGYADCDLNPINGCEVNTATNLSNCGTCGNRCTTSVGMSTTCVAGVCTTACATGFADCDMNPANGCETDTRSNIMQCGRCGNVCPTGPNSTPSCLVGTCRATCMTGFGDCDANPANGCETDLRASATDCGFCRRACTSPPNGSAVCAASACQITCAAGFYLSGTTCQPIPAPGPVAPLSGQRVTSRRPTLEWRLTTPANGAHVDLCRDRLCTTVVTSIDVTGTTTTPSSDLTPGVWYWRLYGRQDRAAGLLPSAVWSFTVGPRPTPADAHWGTSLDLNGDALGDLAVGGSDAPAVFVYHGSPTGFGRTASATLPTIAGATGFGRALTAAGDVNGDGFTDLLVGTQLGSNRAYVFHGGVGGVTSAPSTTIVQSTTGFGATLSAAGDVNHDGFGDVVFGLPVLARAVVHVGARTGLGTFASYTLTGTAGSLFGQSVTGGADLTGDGFDDVVVGAPGASAVFVYTGTRTSLSPLGTRLASPAGAGDFGASVTLAGDVNGDGLADLAIATPNLGRVDVFYGRVGGLAAAPSASLMGDVAAGFGATIACAGDVNNDGFSDLAVASPTGRQVRVYLGSAMGVSTASVLTAPMDPASYGQSLVSAGDAEGDGFEDLVVGAHMAATVFIYRGGAGGLSPASVALTGPAGVGFGFGLAGSWR